MTRAMRATKEMRATKAMKATKASKETRAMKVMRATKAMKATLLLLKAFSRTISEFFDQPNILCVPAHMYRHLKLCRKTPFIQRMPHTVLGFRSGVACKYIFCV